MRACPECGKTLTPVYKRKEKRRIVVYWKCENPNCLVMKVYSRTGPKRLEVVKANAL